MITWKKINWKRLGKHLLFPHVALLLIFVPLSVAFLVYTMVFLGTDMPISYVSYLFAFYTLSVVCLRIPRIIRLFRAFKQENKFARRFFTDTHLRVKLSLYGSLLLNTAYAIFQLGLGFTHRSFWFYSMAVYYILLAVMRFYLLKHTRSYKGGEQMREELLKYRFCGFVMLFMNLALALIVFFMVYWNRTFHHHMITTIAMAAYTFTAFTLAIVNLIRYRQNNSPVYSASRVIALAAACVSMLTLESTMLTTFGTEGEAASSAIMLGVTGGAVVLFIMILSLRMIIEGTKRLKKFTEDDLTSESSGDIL